MKPEALANVRNYLPNDYLVPKLPCRFGISDPTFGRIWIPRRHPGEHQADIVAAICLDCRIQKDLFQNVLLRVTAAETVHLVEDWFHEIDGTGVFTSPMRQHSLGYRQSDGSDDLRDRPMAKTEHAHRIEHPPCHVVASGRGQRHHPMRLGERREAIADPLFGLVGNLDPAIAHVDALTLKAKQHRRRILHIDIEIGQRLSERRSEVAEPPVVEVENRVEFALLQMEHRAMPPKVMDHIVAAGKVLLVLFKQIDAFALTALHLHDVSNGVDTPKVGGVDLQGGPPDGSAAA